MAVSSKPFPPRKRRPPPGSFISPKLPVTDLIKSLYTLATEISSLHPNPPTTILHRHTTSLIRKSSLLSLLFDEISRTPYHSNLLPRSSSIICFEEMHILLQRISTLLEDCTPDDNNNNTTPSISKMWLVVQSDSLSESFHEMNSELLTLLEILHSKELNLGEDVEELKSFVIKRCREDKLSPIHDSDQMRIEVVKMLSSIKKEIAPDHTKLAEIFSNLGLINSITCAEEIELLEDEAQCQGCDDKSRSEIIELIGLVRYGKCVLFGTARFTDSDCLLKRRKSASEANVPADFRCPITLELMRDPVVAATGQTYDRSSIAAWIESGHNTCPKTGQILSHTNLIPNRALWNLIALWCREQRISYPGNSVPTAVDSNGGGGGGGSGGNGCSGGAVNRAALEATKMTVSFLVNKLSSLTTTHLSSHHPPPFSVASSSNSNSNSSSSQQTTTTSDAVDRVVYELRALAKTDSDSRSIIGESGAIPLLVKHLSSDDCSLQVNAVTTLLNLSITEENKVRIMETDSAVNGVIEVLRSGKTWEAKGNAAAALFSLSGMSIYRKKLGKKTRVIRGLLDLVRDGVMTARRDALLAIVSLAGDRETVGKMVVEGAVAALDSAIEELPEESVSALEVIVKRGGVVVVAGVAGTVGLIERLAGMLRVGSGRTRESAAATLVTVCRRGGAEMVKQMAAVEGVEAAVWDLMGNGTARAKRKAGSLMRFLQRWAAGLVDGEFNANNANVNGVPANANVNFTSASGWLESYSLSMYLP